MQLEQSAVAEFRELWRAEFDEELSADEAENAARELVSVFERLLEWAEEHGSGRSHSFRSAPVEPASSRIVSAQGAGG